jgi:hypothetical protein
VKSSSNFAEIVCLRKNQEARISATVAEDLQETVFLMLGSLSWAGFAKSKGLEVDLGTDSGMNLQGSCGI